VRDPDGRRFLKPLLPICQQEILAATIPENFLDLLTTKKAFANVGTVMKGGSPQVTPYGSITPRAKFG
jgi:hypothetical protein